ncbi:MAG: hypothetical protein V1895_00985 [Parcubacteria group bacterium]
MVETKPVFKGDVWVQLEKPMLLGPARGVPGGWVRYGVRAEGPVRGKELVIFEGRHLKDEQLRGPAQLRINMRRQGAEAPWTFYVVLAELQKETLPRLLLAEVRLPLDEHSGFFVQEENPYFSWKSVASDGEKSVEVVFITVTDREHRLVIEGYGPRYEERNQGNSIIEVSDGVYSMSGAQYIIGQTP